MPSAREGLEHIYEGGTTEVSAESPTRRGTPSFLFVLMMAKCDCVIRCWRFFILISHLICGNFVIFVSRYYVKISVIVIILCNIQKFNR